METEKKAIFIAATGQNVGKTTICLGLLAALHKRFPKVGFIKPVGQKHVSVENGISVDKDAYLFKKHFNLPSDWSDISPVIVPSGFTRDYLDNKITEQEMLKKIKQSFNKIANSHSYTVVEGTGHVGVGSIIALNNAKVAASLGLDMVIIASGGLGSSHDELAINLAMCEKYGVNVRGVILNRVLDKKREMILDYYPKTLKKWGIPLIGCIPYNEFLDNPTMRDFEMLFETPLIAGEQHHYRHFACTRFIACSIEHCKEELVPNELIITPADREDIINAILDIHIDYLKNEGEDFKGGIILTGLNPPTKEMIEKIRQVDVPTLYVPLYTYDAMKLITSYTAKIRTKDLPKIEKAINLVEHYIDFDTLCQ